MKKLKPKTIILGIIVLAGLVFGIIKLTAGKSATAQYQTAQVEKGTLISTVAASGSVIAANINNITTQTSGTVKKVYVSDGNTVKQGQVIAEIELDTVGAQNQAQAYVNLLSAANGLNSANNNYRSAQASAENVLDQVKGHATDETLAQKDTRTKAEVARDNAYDSVRLAQVKLNSANLDYQTSSPIIRSPITGVVKSVTIAEGMNLGATQNSSGGSVNQRVATIATQGLSLATFNVSEIDVTKIKPGQKATVTLDSITDKTFTGKVMSVDRVGSTTSNVTSYPVIIQFDLNSDQILPNMAASANIITATKDSVLLIPTTAIQTQSGQSVVRVMNGSTVTDVNVETGLSSDTQTEIISGLTEGQTVITGNVFTSTTINQTSIFSSLGRTGGAGRVNIGR